MNRISRWLVLVVLLLGPASFLFAEKVSDLPAPTGYVSDFAHVLSAQTIQSVDDLCLQLDRQAHAQVAIVTIKTLDDDQPIEEFATQLEEKWGVGKKGTDRGLLMVIATESRRDRIEVGYGLEGILNDAKVGDILRAMAPSAHVGDFDTAVTLGTQRIAQVIAADAGVTLAPVVHQYHYEQQSQPVQLSPWEVLLGAGVLVVIVIILISTGNIGILWMLLSMFLGGGGGGGGGGRRNDGGGGFGGFGGGSSGGGGASGDF